MALVYSAIISACTNSYNHRADETMARAEALMEQHADSALMALDSLDRKQLRGARRRALHGLLLTQARDKNFIDQTSDTLIAPAVSYFDDSNDTYHRMLSHYYLSRIRYYSNDYPSATSELETAMELLHDDVPNEAYWRARIHNDLAEMAYFTSNFSYSIRHQKEAIHLFDSLQLYTWETDAYLSLIRSYQLIGKWELSEKMIDTVKTSCKLPHQDIKYKTAAIHNLVHKKEWNKAANLYLSLCDSTSGYNCDSFDYAFISYLKTNLGDQASAKEWMDKAYNVAKCPVDTFSISYYTLLNHLINNSDEKLQDLFQEYSQRGAKESQFRISNHVTVGSNDYHRNKAEIEHMRAELLSNRLIISVTLLLLIVFISLYILNRYKRLKTTELNKLAILNNDLRNNISILNTSLASNSLKMQEATASLCMILTTGIDQINKIAKKKLAADKEIEVRNARPDNDKKSNFRKIENSFLDDFSKIISSLHSPTVFDILEKNLNLTEDNLMVNFRTDFPSISDKELQFAVLIFSRMSSHTICIILDIPNLETFRTRKSRLKKMIEQIESHFKDLYLQKFNNNSSLIFE